MGNLNFTTYIDKIILQVATVPKSSMQGKTMVSATGGSPQIIQTHAGSQMTTTMAGAGGNNNLNLLDYNSGFLRRPQNLRRNLPVNLTFTK